MFFFFSLSNFWILFGFFAISWPGEPLDFYIRFFFYNFGWSWNTWKFATKLTPRAPRDPSHIETVFSRFNNALILLSRKSFFVNHILDALTAPYPPLVSGSVVSDHWSVTTGHSLNSRFWWQRAILALLALLDATTKSSNLWYHGSFALL